MLTPRDAPSAPEPPSFGMPFKSTNILTQMYSNDGSRRRLTAVVVTHLNKANFFKDDGEWTCYRRNYLQGAASFAIIDQDKNMLVSNIHDTCVISGTEVEPVKEFLMVISCRTTDKKKDARLVQQNPKRDSVSVLPPSKMSTLPARKWGQDPCNEATDFVYRFERIQFKSSTSNNGRRRSPQHFHYVVIELWAKLQSGKDVLIATRESTGLVVRGRSPSHYANLDASGTQEDEDELNDTVSVDSGSTHHRSYHSPSMPLAQLSRSPPCSPQLAPRYPSEGAISGFSSSLTSIPTSARMMRHHEESFHSRAPISHMNAPYPISRRSPYESSFVKTPSTYSHHLRTPDVSPYRSSTGMSQSSISMPPSSASLNASFDSTSQPNSYVRYRPGSYGNQAGTSYPQNIEDHIKSQQRLSKIISQDRMYYNNTP